jgi:Abnormal spindle-like microcephaly-assoc'd, ASPM-SPD-2-Hydin
VFLNRPFIALFPTMVSFAKQLVGTTSAAQTVALYNPSSPPLKITSIVASGDFTQTNTCGSDVAGGANCTVSIIFVPTAAGTRTGRLTITDNSPGSPQVIGLTGTGLAFVRVTIDIKPGDSTNSINPGSKGKIPVAILSSRTFNAVALIDQTSLTFGHSGDEASLAFCNAEDVNRDGLPDLVCHFNTRSAGFVSGDTVGVLKGKTVDGIPVRGTDSVRIIP